MKSRPRLSRHYYTPGAFFVHVGKREVGVLEPSNRAGTPWLYRSAVYHFAIGHAKSRAEAVRELIALDARIVRPKALSLLAPPSVESFRSPGGRRFVLADAEADSRYAGDELWSHDFAVYLMLPTPPGGPKHVGTIFRSWKYGITDAGMPRWTGSLSFLRWATTFNLPRDCGYDVAAFDDVESCVAAWAKSADQILDHVKDKVA